METPDKLCVVSFSLFVIWFIISLIRRPKGVGDYEEPVRVDCKIKYYSLVTVICNVVITIGNLGFIFYAILMKTSVSMRTGLKTMAWVLSTLLVMYYNHSTEGKNTWPLTLRSWWVSSGLLQVFTTTNYIIKHWSPAALSEVISSSSIVDFVTLPCSLYLCYRGLFMTSSKPLQDLAQPLLSVAYEGIGRSGFSDAGLWSRLTFRWLNPVFDIGRSRRLEFELIPPVPEPETAEKCYASLQDSVRKQKKESICLLGSIFQAVRRPLLINAIFAGMNTLFSYLGPFLITSFVEFLSKASPERSHIYGYALAFLLFFSKTVESLSQRQWYFGARQIGMRARSALMVSIYNKTLSTRFMSTGTGKIINFLEVDVERVGDFFWYCHGIWLLPIQVSLALLILYHNLGAAAAVSALLSTVFVMLSNTPLASSQEKLHCKIMEAKDSRIKATSEILKCMRILKLQSWENAYLNKLLQLRQVERRWLKRYLYTCAAIVFLFWTSPTLVSVITFGVCFVVEAPLTPGAVLSALATFRILQEPIYNLPELVSVITQTKVSIDRIQDFVKEEWHATARLNFNLESKVIIEIEPGEYSWDAESELHKPALIFDKKIVIMRGQKVAVCGSVGSGKSSLLLSIIGEIPKTYGAGTKVFGSKAYVPQSAWIQTGTVRDNVLFGKRIYTQFYEDVIEGCALDRDIAVWMDGDMTIIGERGINLSGGQKQRIQLARAIYSDADVYLLDDPFSAVDALTGTHLFKESIMRLLSSKTVIYVTHQLEFLNAADLVLVMQDGKIVQSGKYKDLIADSAGELVKLMNAHQQSLGQVTAPKEQAADRHETFHTENMELEEVKQSCQSRMPEHPRRIDEEERESGRVKWRVYHAFVTSAYRGALVPVILLCQVLFQGFQIASNYWMAWATENEDRVTKEKLIGIFTLLSAGSSVFVLARALLLAIISMETAQRLFLGMITSIFRAPVFFFDTTPSSRILNRSSTDQSIVDTDIPYRLAGLVFALVQLLCIIVVMSSVAWPVLILFVVVLVVSYMYQDYYIGAARQLARMVGIKKAPILHHLSESISGAATVRCFNQEDCFFEKNIALINDYSRVTFHNYATMEWLSMRINFLFNLVFLLVLLILVYLPRDTIDPSFAGLAATYGLNLNVLQAWIIWNLCNVENKMISVERILQFSDIPSEAPLVIEDHRPEANWPIQGTIQIHNLEVRYSLGLPLVLKGISCTFPGEKKIGVLGRTGSGKSTLVQALFRVMEPSGGKILIDGVDISQMGLQDLRSRLSIIPQDPTLFQGTFRTNFDPVGEHPDSEIWEVLSKCHIRDIVKRDKRLLDAPVAEEGENWSVGQRQLVCLARVLLKRRRILVLDEATASMDTATDNIIQKTIREETNNCTVITIAHRIGTVIDSDLVLVLDEGKVLEFGPPGHLLKSESSAFSKLAMEYVGRSNNDRNLT